MSNRQFHSRVVALSAALAAALVLAGCGSGGQSSSSGASGAPGGKNITLILGTSSDDFYKSIECGAKLRSKETGVNLTVQGAGQFDLASGADRQCGGGEQARCDHHRPD